MMIRKLILLFCLGVLIVQGCRSTPKQKLNQFTINLKDTILSDTLRIDISNPLKCPLLVNARTKDDSIQLLLRKSFPLVLPALQDTTLLYFVEKDSSDVKIRYSSTIGDPKDSIRPAPISLPFPKNRRYKIIQGYNGSYSHQSDFSRYAIDFNTKVGDTICAVADGYVTGVIEGYQYGGNHKKWRDYSNFITLYHPEMNLFTQYVHLKHEGAFVEVGDSVSMGQAIGLSGMTGWTDVEHLHFNVLKATQEGVVSTPIEFLEGYKGSELRKGSFVQK